MYKDHPFCIEPKNNAKIWRYMNLAKFVHLLMSKSLYFCRLDKLGDPFEGSLSRVNLQAMENAAIEWDSRGLDAKRILSDTRNLFEKSNRWSFYLNCWHLNEYESDAMWKLYAGSGGGIAVTSTVDHLKKSVGKVQDSIYLSEVKYIDYDIDGIPGGNLFYPVQYKRNSFSHECELRAFLWKHNHIIKENDQQIPQGLPVQIELDELIDEIYVSPLEEDWLTSVVGSLMNQYGLNKTPRHSKLLDPPLF
jgi:hypothetical protein